MGPAAVCALILAASGALAQVQPAGTPGPAPASASSAPATTVSAVTVTAHRPTAVSEVTVTANTCKSPPALEEVGAAAPPRVIDTYPAQGAVVSAGALSIRIVFDQRMFPCSFSYETDFPQRFPAMQGVPPVLQPDGRTFVIATRVNPGLAYGLRLNGAPHAYFVSRSGRPAEPHELRFSTAPAGGAGAGG